MRGKFKREGTYVYLWLFHILFSRNQHNIVKQLSSTLKKEREREREQSVLAMWLLIIDNVNFFAFKLFIFVFQICCYFGKLNIISQ